MNFQQVKFLKSVAPECELFNHSLPEVLFVGRSNVGKSSLINAITGQKRLAYVSQKPGHTKLLNFYEIDHTLMLVDAPGYGYAKGDRLHFQNFKRLLDYYFNNQKLLKCVLFLLDARRVPSPEDLVFFEYATSLNLPLVFVITKVDKLNQSAKAKIDKNIQGVISPFLNFPRFYVSSMEKSSLVPLLAYLSNLS